MTGRSTEHFKAVYDDVFPIISRVVYRITGSIDVSEELCQEAFIRYYENMHKVPDATQAKYWLIRVAKNLALNYEKRLGRERRAFERAYRQPGPKLLDGETSVMREESYHAVQAAIDRLPEKLRTVIVLKEYGNLSYNEIAKTLEITEANVKVRVYRARERLARFLNEGDVYVP